MIAWEVSRDPNVLNLSRGESWLFQDDDGRLEEIPIERARECFEEYHGLLTFLGDWHSGIMTVSMEEYRRLPAVLLDYRRIFTSLFLRAKTES